MAIGRFGKVLNSDIDEFGWRTLKKAEQIAIENEQYELLNNIYHLQIDCFDSEFAPDINEIYKKWENNKVLVNENEKINIAYNFIKKETYQERAGS